MNVIVTWMLTVPKGEKILHAQTGVDSDQLETQLLYWRCIFCLFESSARLNDNARHILFYNQPPPDEIDEIDIKHLIEKYRIECHALTKTTRPPLDYYLAWNTQFIMLDVIEMLAGMCGPEDMVLILDADCIFNMPIPETMVQDVKTHQALVYSLDYPLDYPINGLSRRQLKALALEYDPGLQIEEFSINGGEFICLLGSQLGIFGKRAREAYQVSLLRHGQELCKFHNDEHLLSFVAHQCGYKTHTGNRYIRRIWTQHGVYTNITGNEAEYVIWHLPAEKNRGFIDSFRMLTPENDYSLSHVENLDRIFRIKISAAEFMQVYINIARKAVNYRIGKFQSLVLKRIEHSD